MTLPRWLARFNRILNLTQVERGKWPVLVHVGRKSGDTHCTPLDAHRVEDGYLFLLNYGTSSDWARNILISGEAKLRIDGVIVALDEPTIITANEAWAMLPVGAKPPPSWVGVEHGLLMRLAEVAETDRPDHAVA
jgi:hypothetical protein